MTTHAKFLITAAAALATTLQGAVLASTMESSGSRPLKIVQTTEPAFPETLQTLHLESGEAQIVINVDADGVLVDTLVASYTDEAFADAAIDALQEWRYEPARERGEPVGVRMIIAFSFEARGRVISVTPANSLNMAINSIIGPQIVERLCRPRDLDRPLEVVHAVKPWHPGRTMSPPQNDASVVLDFYVDETGRPRMPVVLSADHMNFAAAAVQALEQWRFAPPTRHGQPVAVRAQQRFVFSEKT
jgi:TonB family protein